MTAAPPNRSHFSYDVAIIGMAGRFPGARNVDEFWTNLHDGVESLSFFTDKELRDAGVDASVLKDPNYIKAKGVLDDIDFFDAHFFAFSPREAECMDPQHRVFLECSWEALESAGYDSEDYDGPIAVFAGAIANKYLVNIYSNPELFEALGSFQIQIANDKDHLPTRASYKLNLKGPSVAVQTTCSTSLVAVHLACQSLLNYECDMALAGGISISLPSKAGYLHRPGGVHSSDGHCRAFDAQASGTVSGNGVGIVVLKRLDDALEQHDTIHAVIKGSAINNDGSFKVAYTAPSADGQTNVILEALSIGNIDADTISYVEAHGTGTRLGDPLEIQALSKAFGGSNSKKQRCPIGSVKTNIGHLDAAAGVSGLIKTVLSLKHRLIPPSLNFKEPNPEIDFPNTPFYVNTRLTDWQTEGTPRRAGVSSFGIGGTNAHVIVEEAPSQVSGASRSSQLLVLSASTGSALERVTDNFIAHLKKHTEQKLADIAHTLHVGRRPLKYRRALVCRDAQEAIYLLEARPADRVLTDFYDGTPREIAFMFPGLGDQYVNMGLELYDRESAFRYQIDRCAEILASILRLDLREILYDRQFMASERRESGTLDIRKMLRRHQEAIDPATAKLNQTRFVQVAVFVTEYALAQMWMSWGIHPKALIGYSIGEYVAACLSGVFSLEDALSIVSQRSSLIESIDEGLMLAIALSEEEARSLLSADLSVAAINGNSMTVIAGPCDAVAGFEQRVKERGIACLRLPTSHALHSAMMERIAEPFTKLLGKFELHAPAIPFISNVTGNWITPTEASDRSYWARHMCETVRFSDGLNVLMKHGNHVLLEVGPGQSLSSIAKQVQAGSKSSSERVIASSLRHSYEAGSDVSVVQRTLGKLWVSGVPVGWAGYYADEERGRVELPSYPFERQRYWVEGGPAAAKLLSGQVSLRKDADISNWFYVPSWKRAANNPSSRANGQERSRWLVFVDEIGVGKQLVEGLEARGAHVTTVTKGKQFAKFRENRYSIHPRESGDYLKVLAGMRTAGGLPNRILHIWSVEEDSTDHASSEAERFERAQDKGLYSLLHLTRALAQQTSADEVDIVVVTAGACEVNGSEELRPEGATISGACRVIPQEYNNFRCRNIDVVLSELNPNILAKEIVSDSAEPIVAIRGAYRWIPTYESLRLDQHAETPSWLRHGGVYLITGGLGRIGLTLAKYLAQSVNANLVLLSWEGLPPRSEWKRFLEINDKASAKTRERVQQVLSLKEIAADALVIKADVADEPRMREVVAEVLERFGRIDGVIHAAGVVGEKAHRAISETGQQECGWHFRPKVYGSYVLERILHGVKYDFCIVISSLSPILGGLGFSAYASAHAFMDAFVQKHNRRGGPGWTTINWEGWQTGERAAAQRDSNLTRFTTTPDEALESFQRILSSESMPQVVISTGNLKLRIDQWARFVDNVEESQTQLHVRPSLRTPYISPQNDTQKTIAEIWQKLLGIERVGINDSFFDLGGHSLLAIQLISRLRESFRMDLPLRTIFESLTVAGLAAAITQRQIEEVDQEKLSDIVAAIKQLSKTELEAAVMVERQWRDKVK